MKTPLKVFNMNGKKAKKKLKSPRVRLSTTFKKTSLILSTRKYLQVLCWCVPFAIIFSKKLTLIFSFFFFLFSFFLFFFLFFFFFFFSFFSFPLQFMTLTHKQLLRPFQRNVKHLKNKNCEWNLSKWELKVKDN